MQNCEAHTFFVTALDYVIYQDADFLHDAERMSEFRSGYYWVETHSIPGQIFFLKYVSSIGISNEIKTKSTSTH